jgi:hypothetical protein
MRWTAEWRSVGMSSIVFNLLPPGQQFIPCDWIPHTLPCGALFYFSGFKLKRYAFKDTTPPKRSPATNPSIGWLKSFRVESKEGLSEKD